MQGNLISSYYGWKNFSEGIISTYSIAKWTIVPLKKLRTIRWEILPWESYNLVNLIIVCHAMPWSLNSVVACAMLSVNLRDTVSPNVCPTTVIISVLCSSIQARVHWVHVILQVLW